MQPIDRLKIAIKQTGLRQYQFAERIGYKPSSLSSILVGKNQMTKQFLNLIEKEFGISTEWIIEGKGTKLIEYKENMEKGNTVQERLQILLNTLGIRQSELAVNLGMSRQAVNHIFNHGKNVSPEFLKKLRDVYNVNPVWMQTGKEEQFLHVKHRGELPFVYDKQTDVYVAEPPQEPRTSYQKKTANEGEVITVVETSGAFSVTIEAKKITKPLIITII